MSEEKENLGTVILRDPDFTKESKELAITSLLQATFVDNRLISVIMHEEGGYIIGVENPTSTGRALTQTMHLSEESLLALNFMLHMYCAAKEGMDPMKRMNDIMVNGQVHYNFSKDLKPLGTTGRPGNI